MKQKTMLIILVIGFASLGGALLDIKTIIGVLAITMGKDFIEEIMKTYK